MKYILASLVLIFLYSCHHTGLEHEMLADGKTWRIRIIDNYICSKYDETDFSKCISKSKPRVEQWGIELCGAKPERIFGCVKHRDESSGVSCFAECGKKEISKQNTKDEYIESDHKSAKELLLEEKNCQISGGMWYEDECHKKK